MTQAGSQYRGAWIVEGIREPYAIPGAPIELIPQPGLLTGRDVPDLVNDVMARIGFVSVVPRPMWMANTGAPRPVSVIVVGPLGGELHQTTLALHAGRDQLLSLAALYEGAAPRVVGGVVETCPPGSAWRTLAMETSAVHWPGSALRRLPDGVSLAQPDALTGWKALHADGRLRLWLSLHNGIAGEGGTDLRVMRLCGLVETMAKETLNSKDVLTSATGAVINGSDGSPIFQDNLRARLYALTLEALQALGLPESTVCPSGRDLWQVTEVWKDWRNAVAHEGLFRPSPLPSTRRAQRDRVEAAALAVFAGGTLEEGMRRYAECLAASVEAMFLAQIMGLI